EKYAWTKLLDQKLGGHERLELYGEAVAKMSQNPHIPQLFRDIFKDAFLPYRSPETLTLFLKEINGFTYDHSEDLGNAFEYLLSILGSQGDAGQFRTPRHIINFIAEVVDPKKGDTILDPACGTAGFLISAYKHILKQQKDKPLTPDEKKKLMNNLVGYDISPDMVKLSKVNMYLHGFAEPKIFEYDTLSSEEKWDEMYDVIMANPPFMSPQGGIRPHKRFSVQANRSEVLFVDYIKEHLRPNGRAGIIVPEGIIFQSAGAYKQLRKILIEDGLFAVVSLPAGVFNPYSGVKTSILFFDNSLAKKTDKILFARVLNDGFDLGAQRRPVDRNDLVRPDNEVDATKVLKGQRIAIETGTKNAWLQENSLFAYEITKEQIVQSGDYNLSAERYRLDNLGEQKTQKYPMVELGDICDLMNGYAFKSENYVDGGTRVIRITNVQKGKIVDDNPKFYPKDTQEPVEKYKLLEGDLLISLTGNVGRVGLLSKELLPAALNQRVACLRVDSQKINPKFLFSLLNKDDFENDCINASSGVAQKNLSTVWLSKYKIPLPPIEVQKEIVEQIEVKQNAIEHAKAIIQNLERERDDILVSRLEN
ncbi:MAG: N-6 DNA methylase, partial [Patescibacteria group bacterium]